MHTPISQQTKAELLQALRQRYLRASKQEKAKILDEVVAVAGCHRKHAIRLLTGSNPASASVPAVARRIYDEAVRQALIVLWEAADRICGKRLKAVLPSLVTALERHGHLVRNATVRQRVLAVSAATIDRLPASVRSNTSYRKKSKTQRSQARRFLWSLVATDVCTGWTEAVALVAREQSLVVEGLEVIRHQFPVPIKGIDSDNDSAFINETLLAPCQQQKLEFTRSRAYQKND
jgi:hypothetical protein